MLVNRVFLSNVKNVGIDEEERKCAQKKKLYRIFLTLVTRTVKKHEIASVRFWKTTDLCADAAEIMLYRVAYFSM
jgi:hypothetical protein